MVLVFGQRFDDLPVVVELGEVKPDPVATATSDVMVTVIAMRANHRRAKIHNSKAMIARMMKIVYSISRLHP